MNRKLFVGLAIMAVGLAGVAVADPVTFTVPDPTVPATNAQNFAKAMVGDTPPGGHVGAFADAAQDAQEKFAGAVNGPQGAVPVFQAAVETARATFADEASDAATDAQADLTGTTPVLPFHNVDRVPTAAGVFGDSVATSARTAQGAVQDAANTFRDDVQAAEGVFALGASQAASTFADRQAAFASSSASDKVNETGKAAVHALGSATNAASAAAAAAVAAEGAVCNTPGGAAGGVGGTPPAPCAAQSLGARALITAQNSADDAEAIGEDAQLRATAVQAALDNAANGAAANAGSAAAAQRALLETAAGNAATSLRTSASTVLGVPISGP